MITIEKREGELRALDSPLSGQKLRSTLKHRSLIIGAVKLWEISLGNPLRDLSVSLLGDLEEPPVDSDPVSSGGPIPVGQGGRSRKLDLPLLNH